MNIFFTSTRNFLVAFVRKVFVRKIMVEMKFYYKGTSDITLLVTFTATLEERMLL